MKAFATLMILVIVSGCVSVEKTVDQDNTLPSVVLNNYLFHAEVFGNADDPVVIVLHGGPGADYRYLYSLNSLSDQYRVVFYDQRGTGLSPRVPAEGIELNTFIDDLDAFVNHFGRGEKVFLIGHSWGAMLASAYAGRHPHKVGKLVLAEPGFLTQETVGVLMSGGWPGFRIVFGFIGAWVAKWRVAPDGDQYARDDYFLSSVLQLMQAPTEQCAGKLPPLKSWRAGSPNFQATIGRMMDDPEWGATLNFVEGIEQFSGETLFVVGGCNQLTGAVHQRKHLNYFNRVAMTVIPQAGHFMFNDQPENSDLLLREFFSNGFGGLRKLDLLSEVDGIINK